MGSWARLIGLLLGSGWLGVLPRSLPLWIPAFAGMTELLQRSPSSWRNKALVLVVEQASTLEASFGWTSPRCCEM
jgi:hypothetical protein